MPNLFGREYSRSELLRRIGHISQIGGVQLYQFEDGPPRGVRVLEFRTGTGLIFKVAIERGMDIGYCEYRGQSLAWIPPTLLAGPWYFEQQTEFGWLRAGLGGFCNTCGLVHIGNPEEDSVEHYNYPPRKRERYGVHDRVALTPGQLMSYGERWDDGRCILEAVGRVVQAQAYGETLVLTRRYTAYLGESRFFLRDEVENAGFLPTVHMLLYHINLGFPIVDDHAEFLAPIAEPPAAPLGVPTSSEQGAYKTFIAPQKDWILQAFEHTLQTGRDGQTAVAIINPHLSEGGMGLYVAYDAKQLPKFLEWRMMGEGMYAVGLEPCSNSFGREKLRKSGELIVLQPGETRTYDLEIGVLDGVHAIEHFRALVG